MKLCKDCKEYLPLDAFIKAEAREMGRYYICKECNKKRRKKTKEMYAPIKPVQLEFLT